MSVKLYSFQSFGLYYKLVLCRRFNYNINHTNTFINVHIYVHARIKYYYMDPYQIILSIFPSEEGGGKG